MLLSLSKKLLDTLAIFCFLNNLAGQSLVVSHDVPKDIFRINYTNSSKKIAINENIFIFHLQGETPGFICSDSSLFIVSRMMLNDRMQYEVLNYKLSNTRLEFLKRDYFDEFDSRIFCNSKIVSYNNTVSVIFAFDEISDSLLTLDPIMLGSMNDLSVYYKVNREKVLPVVVGLTIPRQH